MNKFLPDIDNNNPDVSNLVNNWRLIADQMRDFCSHKHLLTKNHLLKCLPGWADAIDDTMKFMEALSKRNHELEKFLEKTAKTLEKIKRHGKGSEFGGERVVGISG